MYYNMKKEGKLIIVSAPSGSGKSTIINFLLEKDLNLEFSISATSRSPRGEEMNGREYYFLSPEDFRNKINNDEFLEYEEVYKDKYYGTLKSEVERLISEGKNVIFDVDVVGGINIKKFYGDKAISVFIQPPSIDALRDRLQSSKQKKKKGFFFWQTIPKLTWCKTKMLIIKYPTVLSYSP